MNTLPYRRQGVVLTLDWHGTEIILMINRHPETGEICEVFGDGPKVGSELSELLHDCCINLSLQMQDGTPVEFFAHAVIRDPEGSPQSILGLIADALCAENQSEA